MSKSLDCPVRGYEERESPAHGLMAGSDGGWQCLCGAKFKTHDAGMKHLMGVPDSEYKGTGRFLIPAGVVNAHTISRRRIVPDFEEP